MSTYTNHQNIRLPKHDVEYKCNECPQSFSRIGLFHAHNEASHQTAEPRKR